MLLACRAVLLDDWLHHKVQLPCPADAWEKTVQVVEAVQGTPGVQISESALTAGVNVMADHSTHVVHTYKPTFEFKYKLGPGTTTSRHWS